MEDTESENRKLSIDKLASASYEELKAIVEVAKKHIEPISSTIKDGNDKEAAIHAIYKRQYAWGKTLIKLDSRSDFQALAAAARSMFELAVDMRLISENKISDCVPKYHSFSEVDRYKRSQQIVTYVKDSRGASRIDDTENQKHINDTATKTKVDQLLNQYWKNKQGKTHCPVHWSGFGMPNRVALLDIDYQDTYWKLYKSLSWHIHSGTAGYSGFNTDFFYTSAAICFCTCKKMLIDTIRIYAKTFSIDKGLESAGTPIDDLLEKASLVTEEIIIDMECRKHKDRPSMTE